jgi:hypothetical protein
MFANLLSLMASDEILRLKDMVDGSIDDITEDLDLLKKDLIKTVSVYNVNGVLVIGRVVQTIKKVAFLISRNNVTD